MLAEKIPSSLYSSYFQLVDVNNQRFSGRDGTVDFTHRLSPGGAKWHIITQLGSIVNLKGFAEVELPVKISHKKRTARRIKIIRRFFASGFPSTKSEGGIKNWWKRFGNSGRPSMEVSDCFFVEKKKGGRRCLPEISWYFMSTVDLKMYDHLLKLICCNLVMLHQTHYTPKGGYGVEGMVFHPILKGRMHRDSMEQWQIERTRRKTNCNLIPPHAILVDSESWAVSSSRRVTSRELISPTWGRGISSSQLPLNGIS